MAFRAGELWYNLWSMKVCFETFGCRLNRAEALDQEAEYLADGWELTSSHSDADVIVVRGCSVTRRAQRDCERLIAHIRKKYPLKRLLIEGCIATGHSAKVVVQHTPSALRREKGVVPVPTRTARAYLKVQDGCAGKCSFCIVPKFRGQSKSVDFDAVLDKAKRFIDAGYHEIVVTGCNLSLYASGGKRLPELLAALAALSPDCRIRLGSLEPSDVAIDTVTTMAGNSNVCRFMHIPVQSASNRILTAMKRPYLIKEVRDIVFAIRKQIPDAGIGCDLMTGFPSESDLDFMATRGMLERDPFTRVHVFPYSERPGTSAAALTSVVPPEIRKARARELTLIADKKRTAFAIHFIGKTTEIVVEDEDTCSGWTSEYLWCSCPNTHKPRKSLVRVLIVESKGHTLIGTAI